MIGYTHHYGVVGAVVSWRESRDIEHIGSAYDDAGPEALKRLHGSA
jgi:hypothetical protein